jgi:hypothetical protein
MKWKNEDLPALRALEAAALEVWKKHEDMSDYVVARAYEALYQQYRARFRGHPPKPPGLTQLDLECYEAVQAVSEKLLAEGAKPLRATPGNANTPVSLEKLVEYLRELCRSVDRHTKLEGRQGYLQFLRQFIH